MILGIITAVLPIFKKVLDLIPDENKRRELEHAFNSALMENQFALEKAAADIIKTEAQSKWALAAVWRPLLMLSLVAIIVNNYILAPYLKAIFDWAVVLNPPEQLWTLLTIGVGGYVVGRSGEKMVKTWKENGNDGKE